jgi:hypothetical protein
VGEIFQINHNDLPWYEYEEALDADGRPQIRVKALTVGEKELPPVQFVEYAAEPPIRCTGTRSTSSSS